MGVLVLAVSGSLIAGGIGGFLLGVATSELGAAFLTGMVEQEQPARTQHPREIVRERFELRYPENWTIDTADEDYDPDHRFTIESPGAAHVMFFIGQAVLDPEDAVRDQIEAFSSLMGAPSIERFESYGRLAGRGAVMRGRILGISVTVKAFACCAEGVTAIIVQQCPDDDAGLVRDGFELIEQSLMLRPVG